MADIYSTTPPYQEPPRKRNTALVVTIILLLLLCCCCGLLVTLWFTGDQLLDWFNVNIQMFWSGIFSL